jgi:hypothetical protein
MSDPMTDNDQFQAYRSLSEQMHTQYTQRRELEWKNHVAIWTLLAAVGYLLVVQKIHLGCHLFALLVMVPLHALWCVKIHTGEFRDQSLSVCYRRAAERILVEQSKVGDQQLNTLVDDGENRAPQPPPWLRDLFEGYAWWFLAEVGTTALIAVAVIYIAW